VTENTISAEIPADTEQRRESIAGSTYGSDKAGLVCAYVFEPDLPGRTIDAETAAMLLAAPTTGPEFMWLHFSLSNSAAGAWLQRHLTLPEPFYESIQERSSTRVEAVDSALLAVFNDVQFFDAEPSSAATLTLCVTARYMVSARTTQLRAADRLRASVKRGETFRSPATLLAHLLRDQGDVLVEIVRDATKQVDAFKDRILTGHAASRQRLGTLRRILVRLQRLLAPEPAALFRLLNQPPAWLRDDDVSDLRHSAEELSAAVSDSAALVERIRLLQEELLALINEQTNRTLFILTIVTVPALPLTIIPGMFGMNVRGIPFSEHQAGFWLVMVVVFSVVGLAVALARWHSRNQ
jgi:zinc transporter